MDVWIIRGSEKNESDKRRDQGGGCAGAVGSSGGIRSTFYRRDLIPFIFFCEFGGVKW